MDPAASRRIRDVLRAANRADGARELFDGRAAFLVPLRAGEADLEGFALDRFASVFDALELAILVCRSHTSLWRWMVPDRSDAESHDWGEIALVDLFQAGILVASEVLALLRTGYTTGALARWRALHETTTKAEFISGAGKHLIETAERYVKHEEFREIQSLELWKGLDKKLTGNEAGVGDTITEMAKERRAAIVDYGKAFQGEYGWAQDQLLAICAHYRHLCETGKRENGPRLDDLERLVRQGDEDPPPVHWRYLTALANSAVHGSPRSHVTFKDGKTFMRLGPHVDGSSQAGEFVGLAFTAGARPVN